MEPISGTISKAALSTTAVREKEPLKAQQTDEESYGRPSRPVTDEYIPEEKQEPTGRYWVKREEDGKPKIYFDDPGRAADASGADAPNEDKKADGLEKKSSDDKGEKCTCNTDKVDREIEKLKKKQAELEQQLNSETDETKIRNLEKKLAQVESELRSKDNDTYRRQHAEYTFS